MQIERFVKRVGRRPPEDLLRVLAWHDGSKGHDLDGYYNLLSLSGIVRMKQTLDELIPLFEGDGWLPGEWWHRDWLPFLEFNGDLLCLDLSGTAGEPGQVLSFKNYDDVRRLEYRSVRHWLHAVTTLWERTPSGATEEEERTDAFVGKAAARVRKALDPGYPIHRRARHRPAPKPEDTHREAWSRGPYEWEIQRTGTLVRTRWGRASSRRQHDKDFETEEEARAFVERQTRAKASAGYVEARATRATKVAGEGRARRTRK